MENLDNPAMKRVVKQQASPGAVAEAMEDPTVFEQIARGDLYIELTRLRRLAASNAMPLKLRMEYAQLLSKMGRVERPATTQGGGENLPVIQIVLPNSRQTTQLGGQVIEHEQED